jgi:hypothetical protein
LPTENQIVIVRSYLIFFFMPALKSQYKNSQPTHQS